MIRFALAVVIACVFPLSAIAADNLDQETAKAAVKKYLEHHVSDPSTLKFVAFDGADLDKCMLWTGPKGCSFGEMAKSPALFKPATHKGWAIFCKFHASNGNGEVVLHEQAFILNKAGKVTQILGVPSVKVVRKEGK